MGGGGVEKIEKLVTCKNVVTFKESENVYNVVNGAVLPEKFEKEILLYDVEGVQVMKRLLMKNQSKKNIKKITT